MQRFQKILVYVHLYDLRKANPAAQHAAELAEINDADVKLLCVHDDFWTDEEDDALEKLAAPLRQRGLRVTTAHPFGDGAEEVIREVLKNKHDLVMKTARPEDARRMAFGATAIRLMRMCPCPVWIVQPSQMKPFERVLAAIDPRPDDNESNAINIKILELAMSLAQLQSAELQVLHAWSVHHEKLLKIKVASRAFQEFLQATANDAQSRVTHLLSPFAQSVHSDQIQLVKGDAADVIPQFARDRQVDIIVMGTVVRTGIAGFVMGDTAERIFRRVNCSVLTLKPDGFVSPIHL